MSKIEKRLDSFEKKLDIIERSLNYLTKESHDSYQLSMNTKVDTQHMYKIVRQLHKEHKKIMQLNGHSTLLEVLDKLEE